MFGRARNRRLAVIAIAALIAPLGGGLAPSAQAASSTTVVVTPADLNGWQEYHLNDLTAGCTETSTGSQSWVTGPATPPAGTGSHQYSIGANGDSYEKLRTNEYDGTLLTDLTTLSYSTYVSQNIGGQAVFLILSVDTTGDDVADAGLFFEPVYQTSDYSGDPVPDQGDLTLNTWQTWDALTGGYWVGTGGPPLVTLANYAAANPGAKIAPSVSGAGGVQLAAGCGAGAWDNFVGNVDNLTVGVNDDDKIYDFEPTPTSLVWKGQTWDISPNATAEVNLSDHAVIERFTGTADATLHVNRIAPAPGGDSFINANGTPWVQWSYLDNGAHRGVDVLIDSERVPDDPRLQAGTLFACEGLGYVRYNIPAIEEFAFEEGCDLGAAPNTIGANRAEGEAHTIYVGQRADGTIDYNYDGTWFTSTFLRDNTGPFDFNDVYLRLRGNNGASATFTDFQYGDDHIGPISPGDPVVIDDDGQGSTTDCNAADFAFSTVQAGVDFATAGDTITVCPGTYTEQVTVQKDLTLAGTDEATVIIKAPASLVDSACVGSGQKVVVDICGGASVGLEELTVSGPGPAGCGSLHYGVFVTGDATLDASHITIQDIRDEPAGGCQNGIGLRIGSGPLGQVGHGTVANVTIKRYQKGGVVVDGAGTDADVRFSNILGVGPTATIAANGIQVSREAVAYVLQNTVSGNECDHASCGPSVTDASGAGILLFQASSDTVVESNKLLTNDMGVYNLAPDTDTGTVSILSNFFIANRYYGVFLDQGAALVQGNIIDGSAARVGIEVFSFAGSAQATTATILNNRFARDATEIEVQEDPGAPGVSVTANGNKFRTPGVRGVVNHTDTVIDATNNWWRSTDGPSDWSTGFGVTVSDNVDFFPWYTDGNLTTLAVCTVSGVGIVLGTAGPDIMCGSPLPDIMSGMGGRDLILGNGGDDTVSGGNGFDAIIGHGGSDTLNGQNGSDDMQGREGTDTCSTDVGDRTSSCE